jgi:tetratricopeptide (TPR) repeat protein
MRKTRNILLGSLAALAAATTLCAPAGAQQPQKPNIVIIWGDDVGQSNVSAYSRGLMGYQTPNIDRVANEGVMFTDYYAEQSCTAGRASFITGQSGLRTGLTKVGLPGATLGLQKEDPTTAELLKPLGYATGQFGKNHLGDRNEFLPTVHGFDEFYGNLYHLNAIERFARAMRLSPLDPWLMGMRAGTAYAHFFLGRYDEAASWAAMALQDNPDYQPGLRIAAASNAMAGRPEQVHKAVARLRQLNPALRVSNLKDVVGPFRRAEDLARYGEGLRQAGLPE